MGTGGNMVPKQGQWWSIARCLRGLLLPAPHKNGTAPPTFNVLHSLSHFSNAMNSRVCEVLPQAGLRGFATLPFPEEKLPLAAC